MKHKVKCRPPSYATAVKVLIFGARRGPMYYLISPGSRRATYGHEVFASRATQVYKARFLYIILRRMTVTIDFLKLNDSCVLKSHLNFK